MRLVGSVSMSLVLIQDEPKIHHFEISVHTTEESGDVFNNALVENGFAFLPSDDLLVEYKKSPSLAASLLIRRTPLSAL